MYNIKMHNNYKNLKMCQYRSKTYNPANPGLLDVVAGQVNLKYIFSKRFIVIFLVSIW